MLGRTGNRMATKQGIHRIEANGALVAQLHANRAAGPARVSSSGRTTVGQLAVLLMSGAPLGQVQSPADQRMPTAGGIGQGHRHLAQRDTTCRAAVGRRRPSSAEDFSSVVSSTISTPYPSSRCGHPRRRDVQDPLVVPYNTRQQVLQPVRPAMPYRLGDWLAVMIACQFSRACSCLASTNSALGLPPSASSPEPPGSASMS